MSIRRFAALALMISAVAWFCIPTSAPGADPPDKPRKKRGAGAMALHLPEGAEVFRFVGTRQSSAWGRNVMKIDVTLPFGGSKEDFVVPNRDPLSKKYDPPPAVLAVVKELKPGDYILLMPIRFHGVTGTRFVTPYELAPGEDEPNVFVFDTSVPGLVRGLDHLAVKLAKLGSKQVVYVPHVKDAKGKMSLDARLVEAIGEFAEGDSVEVAVRKVGSKVMLTQMLPYAEWQAGTFVKYVRDKEDRAKVSVTLKQDEQEKTFDLLTERVGGQLIAHRQLAKDVMRWREGQYVKFKTAEQGGKTLLTRIVSAKKPR
jgi:hypothetical protein